MDRNSVLNEIEKAVLPLQRKDVMLTPEEARLYERYSVEQVQAMAMATPAVKTRPSVLEDVSGAFTPEIVSRFMDEINEIKKY